MSLTIKDLAADIALAGVPFETARNRVSHFAQSRLISGRRDGVNTSPTIYRPTDAAIAIALSALQDSGIADLEIMEAASIDLHLRIADCLAGLANGESWSLVVEIYRHTSGGFGRFISPRLVRHPQPAAHRMPLGMTPRGAIIVVLDEMLLPVVRRLHPPKGAH
ncbi:hypothetical protein [Mesorhizobium sp. A623]